MVARWAGLPILSLRKARRYSHCSGNASDDARKLTSISIWTPVGIAYPRSASIVTTFFVLHGSAGVGRTLWVPVDRPIFPHFGWSRRVTAGLEQIRLWTLSFIDASIKTQKPSK